MKPSKHQHSIVRTVKLHFCKCLIYILTTFILYFTQIHSSCNSLVNSFGVQKMPWTTEYAFHVHFTCNLILMQWRYTAWENPFLDQPEQDQGLLFFFLNPCSYLLSCLKESVQEFLYNFLTAESHPVPSIIEDDNFWPQFWNILQREKVLKNKENNVSWRHWKT